MKSLKLSFILLALLSSSLLVGCQNKKSKQIPKLSSIDLLRGELVICSSDQFGDVNFSLSCNYDMRETFDLAVSLLHSCG